ncbi:MAG: UbiA-like polyprenyltransferase [Bacillota bacterium]|nr:UbiA-like polyprenyltransferase [Bacillota bacterium]
MSEAAETLSPPRTVREKVVLYLRMIDFHESVFSLPFAFVGALLGSQGRLTAWQVFWIVVAMVGARTVALAFNRLIDVEFDARNPRTAGAILPRGLLSRGEVWLGILLAAGAYFLAAAQLNRLCLLLSPLALAFIMFYSYTKRFTWWTHGVLGLALGLSPVAGWLAVAGRIELPALVLGLAVATWVAGFDIIFALQDEEADRQEGLYSIPAVFGRRAALIWSAAFHLLTVAFFAGAGLLLRLNLFYWLGVLLAAALLTVEHLIISVRDLSRLHTAYFRVNGLVSLLFLLCTWAAVRL